MTIEIVSLRFIQTEVAKVERIDMAAMLTANGMWLILEGFLNGYVFTEMGVDRLHQSIHDTIQPESAVVSLHTLTQSGLVTLFN